MSNILEDIDRNIEYKKRRTECYIQEIQEANIYIKDQENKKKQILKDNS